MNNFERITASPETLGEFLAALNVADPPWDDDFHREFCDGCGEENCDAENCPHNEARGDPLRWLCKEVVMPEPNTCKLLGVGVGVKFRIGKGSTVFWIRENGHFQTDPPCANGASYSFMNALNGLEEIRLLERNELTGAELERCRVYGANWVSRDDVGKCFVKLWRDKPMSSAGWMLLNTMESS